MSQRAKPDPDSFDIHGYPEVLSRSPRVNSKGKPLPSAGSRQAVLGRIPQSRLYTFFHEGARTKHADIRDGGRR